MRLDNRITTLEKRLSPKQQHVLQYTVDRSTDEEQVKQVAIQAYCEKHGLDHEKLENEDYGGVLYLARIIVAPGDVHGDKASN